MQINFKQPEIQAALRQYIAGQGINLTGKTVDIAFTAGRGANGLTAEVTIEDSVAIPGFTDAPGDNKPVLAVVKNEPAVAAIANDATEKAKTVVAVADIATEAAAAPVAEAQAAGEVSAEDEGYSNRPLGQLADAAETVAEEEKPKTTSLFG